MDDVKQKRHFDKPLLSVDSPTQSLSLSHTHLHAYLKAMFFFNKETYMCGQGFSVP